MVEINYIEGVDTIFEFYDNYIDLTLNWGMLTSFCHLLKWTIGEIYSQIREKKEETKDYPEGTVKRAQTFDELIEESAKVLKYLNIYMIYDSMLYVKYVRCLQQAMKS